VAALFYYFLVGAHGAPHNPPVVTTEVPHRRVGEVLVLDDGSSVLVREIEMTVEAESAGRGFDGVLVVESHAA
jgi:hypothetical protein